MGTHAEEGSSSWSALVGSGVFVAVVVEGAALVLAWVVGLAIGPFDLTDLTVVVGVAAVLLGLGLVRRSGGPAWVLGLLVGTLLAVGVHEALVYRLIAVAG